MTQLIGLRHRVRVAVLIGVAGLAVAGCGATQGSTAPAADHGPGGAPDAGAPPAAPSGPLRVGAGAPVTIARGQEGPSYLTAAGNAQGGAIYGAWTTYAANPNLAYSWVSRSTDGGRTWTHPLRLGGDTATQPELAVGADGAVYAVWSQWNTKVKLHLANTSCLNPTTLMFAVSHDQGATWSTPRAIDPGDGRACQLYGAIAVGAGGSLAIGWFDYTTNPGPDGTVVTAAQSTDDGASFSAPAPLGTACVCCTPEGVAVNGHPAILFRGWKNLGHSGQLRDPMIAVATGSGWAPARTVHDDDFRFRVCPHAGLGAATNATGTSYLGWWTGAPGREGYWYATTRNGTTFTAPIELTAQHADPMGSDVHIAIDGAQHVWVTAMTVPGPDSKDSSSMLMSPNSSVHAWVLDGDRPQPVPAATATGSEPASAASRTGAALLWVHGETIQARTLTAGGAA